jgi:glycosyltransferase involved in cell wall biosynthesis
VAPPKIALCIPAYNCASYLPRLLKSAHAQKVAFEEVIVCDDASQDDTVNVARSFGAKVLVNETNVGCSISKNRGLAAASSDWIHFHDADDELLPNFTTLATRWAATTDAPDVILFDYEYRDYGTGELIGRSDFNDAELRADPIRYSIINQINPFCGLYRRNRLLEVGGWDVDPEVLYNEDVAFHCKLAVAGFSFRAEKELSIINYRRKTSMSRSNQIKCLRAHHAVMRKMVALVGDRYAKETASRLWAVATGLATFNDWGGVDQALADARRLSRALPEECAADFGLLCRLIGPRLAFRVREKLIRRTKPNLRAQMSAPANA